MKLQLYMHKFSNSRKAFTLIELLLVIAILGILATLISGNFLNTLKRGRDTRRKEDLKSIQIAFESYYEDNMSYPASDALNQTQLCHPDGCDTKVYMQKIPTDPNSSYTYDYATDSNGTYYSLYSCLENGQDTGPGVKLDAGGEQDGNGWVAGCGCGVCKFKIESSNVSN